MRNRSRRARGLTARPRSLAAWLRSLVSSVPGTRRSGHRVPARSDRHLVAPPAPPRTQPPAVDGGTGCGRRRIPAVAGWSRRTSWSRRSTAQARSVLSPAPTWHGGSTPGAPRKLGCRSPGRPPPRHHSRRRAAPVLRPASRLPSGGKTRPATPATRLQDCLAGPGRHAVAKPVLSRTPPGVGLERPLHLVSLASWAPACRDADLGNSDAQTKTSRADASRILAVEGRINRVTTALS